jgi:hypothetical protein
MGDRSLCNSHGPGLSAYNGNGGCCPVSVIITGVRLNECHQLLMP